MCHPVHRYIVICDGQYGAMVRVLDLGLEDPTSNFVELQSLLDTHYSVSTSLTNVI